MTDLDLRLFFFSPWTEKLLPLVLACLLALAVFPLLFSPSDPSRRRLRIALILGATASSLAAWQLIHVDHDEVEHLHSAWLMSQGLLPFRDFWQHHLPTLWILLAPLTASAGSGSSLLETCRLGCLAFAAGSGLIAWRICQIIYSDKDISWQVFLFFWAALLIPFQWNILRPDLAAAPLVLTGLLLLLKPGGCSGSNRFLSGLCLGAAASLTPKPAALVLATGIAEAFHRPLQAPGVIVRKGLTFFTGVATGLLPLAVWLNGKGLIRECAYWVFTFNRKVQSIQPAGGILPLSLLGIALVIWLVCRAADPGRQNARDILAAGILAGVFPMLVSPHKYLYHLQLTALLALIALLPAATDVFRKLAAGRRFVILACLCVAALLPSHYYTRYAAWSPFYEKLVQLDILESVSKKGGVSLIFPDHPILARNVTGFDHAWFWNFLEMPSLHGDLKGPLGSFTEHLMERRPLLVATQRRVCNFPFSLHPDKERHVLGDHLLNTGFIDKAGRDRLQGFLDGNYRLVNIMNGWFWLRNDIPEIY